MKISIIVPIYKVEKYINKCIDSIINQTYKNLEIILVDDGSPDNCPAICDEYAKADSRIKVVHKENGGLMSARQAGLKTATGDFVGFVDGDDFIAKNMYERFAEKIEKYSPDVCICEFWFSFFNEKRKSMQNLLQEYFNKNELKEKIYPKMLFSGAYYSFGVNPCCWSKVFKRSVLEKNLFAVTKKIRIGEDAAFTYPCLLDAQSVAYIDEPLYFYRVNEQSMTKSYDENLKNTILIPYDILKRRFKNYSGNYENQLDYYLLFLFNMLVRNETSTKSQKSRKEKIDLFKSFLNESDIVAAVKSINKRLLPLHTRLLACFIQMKSPNLILLYSALLRRFL